jgi:hypothetical protein
VAIFYLESRAAETFRNGLFERCFDQPGTVSPDRDPR